MKTLQQIHAEGEREFEDEFRKQFDELGLKFPKNSMKNLERELILDYWRKKISNQQTIAWEACLEMAEKRLMDYFDNLESTDPETGAENWKNYIRDCLSTLTPNQNEK